MTDIVERLRKREGDWHDPIYDEAADEIERLQELLRMSYPEQHAEIERLRAALRECIRDLDLAGVPVAARARRALEQNMPSSAPKDG